MDRRRPIPLDAGGVDVIIHDLAVRVLFMLDTGEVEVTAVMAESVVIGVNILPSPTAWPGSQYIGFLSAMFSPSSSWNAPGTACSSADLNRLEYITLRLVNLLVSGHEDAMRCSLYCLLQCSAFNITKMFNALSFIEMKRSDGENGRPAFSTSSAIRSNGKIVLLLRNSVESRNEYAHRE